MKRYTLLRVTMLLFVGIALLAFTACDDPEESCGDSADVVGETGGDGTGEATETETEADAWEGGVTIVKVTADDEGVTHFSEEEVAFAEVDYAPPSPPVLVSATTPAAGFLFIEGDPSYDSGLHPSPARQIVVILRGSVEVEVSDGEIREFGQGSVVLVEDVEGDGHITRATNGGGAVLMAVPLPPE